MYVPVYVSVCVTTKKRGKKRSHQKQARSVMAVCLMSMNNVDKKAKKKKTERVVLLFVAQDTGKSRSGEGKREEGKSNREGDVKGRAREKGKERASELVAFLAVCLREVWCVWASFLETVFSNRNFVVWLGASTQKKKKKKTEEEAEQEKKKKRKKEKEKKSGAPNTRGACWDLL